MVKRIPVQATASEPEGRPTFSVVIPCYNYGHYLPQCARSVLDQHHVEVEVLVVDDASPDGSAQVARALAGADSRVRVIVHEQNLGHIASYNEGLASVTGTYSLLLSADDLLTPGALARAAALMDSHPEVGLVYGHRIPFVGPELPAPHLAVAGWTIWSGEEWVARLCRLGTNVIASPEAVLRSEVQQKIGSYRADLPHSGDMEMWLRAAAVGDVARIDGADQAFYREHATSMSRTKYYAVPLRDLEARRAAFEVAFDGVAGSLPAAARLRRRALRTLASEALDMATALQQRNDAPPDAFQEVAAFAVDTFPGAAGSFRYRALRVRGAVRPGRPPDGALAIADRAATRTRNRVLRHFSQNRLREVASLPPR